ncbi:cytochrome c oxidase assembly protein [Spirillospora sp. NPDC048832]
MHEHPGHHGADALGAWSQAAPLLLLSGILLVVYVSAAANTRSTSRPWSSWRTTFWIAGCAVVAVAASPLLAEHGDLRSHMVQHILLGMIAPLGLVLGRPMSLLLRTASPPARRGISKVLRSSPLRVLGHPVTAALLSAGGLYAVLLTPLYAAAGDHPILHLGVQLHYLAAGSLFTFSVVAADPVPHRPGPAFRVLVVFLAAAAHAVLAKYLYAHAATLPLSAQHAPEAIRDCAQVMYYGGDIAELLLATAFFAMWYKRRPRVRTRPLHSRP